jgi:hypothetical protein
LPSALRRWEADEQAATPAATAAPDAAATEPPKGKAKRGKAAHAATSGETKTGPACAADGTLKNESIPVDEPAAAPERKPERKGRKPKAAKEPKVKKVSGLDAAAMVLGEAGTPMKAVDMLAEIQRRGLWQTKGKTPEATLYAAIIREIAAKGREARFKKHDLRLFVANAIVG